MRDQARVPQFRKQAALQLATSFGIPPMDLAVAVAGAERVVPVAVPLPVLVAMAEPMVAAQAVVDRLRERPAQLERPALD